MTTRRAPALLLSVSALVLTGSVAAPPASAATRTTASIRVSQPHPIANEQFVVSGRLSTRFRRLVTLRVKTAGRAWRPLRRATTSPRGAYSFRVATARVGWYSVSVPGVRHSGRRYGRAVTRVRRVAPVAQTGSIDVLPPVSQRGRRPAASTRASGTVVATFTPARPGRAVEFRKRSRGGAWVLAGRTTQRADGRAYYFGATTSLAFKGRAAGGLGAAAVTTEPGTGSWAATFADEFGGTSLDRAKWSYRVGPSPSRTQSTNDPRAVSVSGGTLGLHVLRDPAQPARRLLTSQVSTADSFTQTYGMFAARIKFPRARGQHGSFWMTSPTYGAYPGDAARSGAEIDVVESFGRGAPGGGLANFLYYRDGADRDVQHGGVQRHAARLIPAADTWYNSFHVFSVKWTPSRYTFYVDGRVISSSNQALSRTDEYLILSMLASDWELKHLDRRALPSRMSVDWAKAWQAR